MNDCQKELDIGHLTWCHKIYTEIDYRYVHLLNGTLNEKIETFKQINRNQDKRKQNETPCDPVNCLLIH